MKIKSVLTAILLTFVIASLGLAVADVAGLRSTTPSSKRSLTNQTSEERWVVYYFHSSTRCPTCFRFEENTHAAFAEELKAGSVDLQVPAPSGLGF